MKLNAFVLKTRYINKIFRPVFVIKDCKFITERV